MANFYCEYCGYKYPTVQSLVAQLCIRHPAGINKGRHKLYEGSEKSQYTCKFCGKTFRDIQSMVAQKCMRHPDGINKGHHAPAL